MSVEAYLEMEDASVVKHDFIDGSVYRRPGADFPHNQIVSNAQGEIYQFLKGKACRIYGSDLKVHVKTKSDFAYPDLTILCDPPQFFPGKKGIPTNPSVIIEVLSPETELYDRTKKFMLYRQIETVLEYILISSMETLVEVFKKSTDGTWALKDYKSVDESVTVEAINYQITLAEIYRDVIIGEEEFFKEQA